MTKTHWVSIVERLKVKSGRSEHNAARIAHKRSDPFCCTEKKKANVKILEQMPLVTLIYKYCQ